MKIKFENRQYLNEFDGDPPAGGDGGGEQTPTPNDGGIWDDPQGGGVPAGTNDGGGQPVAPGTVPQQQPVQLTPEQWMQVQQASQPQMPQQQQQLSDEEINKLLNVYQPDAAFLTRMFGMEPSEEQVAATQEFIGGIVKHLTTVMQSANGIMQSQMMERISPALEMVDHQKMTAFSSELISAYPALKGHEAAVEQVTQSLKASGFQAQSAEHARQVVAGHVEQMLKGFNPQFSLSAAPQQQANNPNMPPMNPAVPNGGGGSPNEGGQGGQPKKPAWQSVFD